MRIFLTIAWIVTPVVTPAAAFPMFDFDVQQSASESQTVPMAKPETAAPKKEWLGESGYCNCLLVAMSRLQLSKVVLSTEKPLPNLDELTSERPDTNKWIKAQELKYADLNRLTVIRSLAELAGIEPRKRTGTIKVHDVVGDNGPKVERVFELVLADDGEGLSLTVNLVTKP